MAESVMIFSGKPGRVAVLNGIDSGAPSTIGQVALEGWGGYNSLKAIIMNCQLAKSANYQFLHTLGGMIYVYTFGDRVGSLNLSGVAFANDCSENNTMGIEKVLQYYDTYKISKRSAPIKVTIGSTTLVCLLTGCTVAIADPENLFAQFTLQLVVVPDPAQEDQADDANNYLAAINGDDALVTGSPPPVGEEEFMPTEIPPISNYWDLINTIPENRKLPTTEPILNFSVELQNKPAATTALAPAPTPNSFVQFDAQQDLVQIRKQ